MVERFTAGLCVDFNWVLASGGSTERSGQVPLHNSISISLKTRLSTPFWEKVCISQTLLLVRFPPSMTVMSSFFLGHMNSPRLVFVPPVTRQQWTHVSNLLTLKKVVFLSLLCHEPESFHINCVFPMYLHLRKDWHFHVTFPVLISWSCEFFVRAKKRLWWFLEGKYQGWPSLLACAGVWTVWCRWSPGMQESKPSVAPVYRWGVWL